MVLDCPARSTRDVRSDGTFLRRQPISRNRRHRHRFPLAWSPSQHGIRLPAHRCARRSHRWMHRAGFGHRNGNTPLPAKQGARRDRKDGR